jgi:hypothetical protein
MNMHPHKICMKQAVMNHNFAPIFNNRNNFEFTMLPLFFEDRPGSHVHLTARLLRSTFWLTSGGNMLRSPILNGSAEDVLLPSSQRALIQHLTTPSILRIS